MRTIISVSLLAVVTLIHCQEHEQMIVFTLQGVLEKLEGINDRLEDMQQKLGNHETHLQDMQQKLGNLETNFHELHHELEHVKGVAENNQDSLQKLHLELEHVKGATLNNQESLQRLSQETGQCLRGDDLEHLTNVSAAAQQEIKSFVHEEISGVISLAEKGLSQETGQCLRGDVLEHLTNVSAAAQQEIKSYVHEEISGVISLAEKDECSEGSHPCGRLGKCHNTLFSFTCSCPSGFTWDGSECADIDECIQGKADCSSNQGMCTNTLGSYSCSCIPPFEGDGRTCSCPLGFASKGDVCEDIDECAEGKGVCHPKATCKNSIGSCSCSCNKPFEGDGRTSCEFSCRSPSKDIGSLGCIRRVFELKTFQEMKDFCREEGGRLLQHFNQHQLDDVRNTLGYFGEEWVGVYEGKWTSDESLVPEDLWYKGFRSDHSWRCGVIGWGPFPYSFKVTQLDCSSKSWGFCQFQLP